MEDQNDVLDLDFSSLVVATLDDELLLRQLGRLSVAFSALEEWVINLLGELGSQPKGSLRDLLQQFKALGKSRLHNDYLDEFETFIKNCDSARLKRNTYFHCRWYEREGTTLFLDPKATRLRQRAAAGSNSGEPRQVTDRDVGAVADECTRLAEELWSTWPSRLGLED